MASPKLPIDPDLNEPQFRHEYAWEHVQEGIAFQIRATRIARGWSQEELGERAGMTQSRISVVEDPNYGKFTLNTLRRFANAFDVALVARFVRFSELSDWAASVSEHDLAIPEYDRDKAERDEAIAAEEHPHDMMTKGPGATVTVRMPRRPSSIISNAETPIEFSSYRAKAAEITSSKTSQGRVSHHAIA